MGEPGVAQVVTHSITFQYLPAASQARIRRHFEAAAAAAAGSPLAWLAFEQRGDGGPALSLRLWPGGEEIILALADAHGRQVRWLGDRMRSGAVSAVRISGFPLAGLGPISPIVAADFSRTRTR